MLRLLRGSLAIRGTVMLLHYSMFCWLLFAARRHLLPEDSSLLVVPDKVALMARSPAPTTPAATTTPPLTSAPKTPSIRHVVRESQQLSPAASAGPSAAAPTTASPLAAGSAVGKERVPRVIPVDEGFVSTLLAAMDRLGDDVSCRVAAVIAEHFAACFKVPLNES
jgi:hypothetical protein